MHVSLYIIQEFEPVHVKIAPRHSWEVEKLGYSTDGLPVLSTAGSCTQDIDGLQEQRNEEI